MSPALTKGIIAHDVVEKEWVDKDAAMSLANTLIREHKAEAHDRDIERFVNMFFSKFQPLLTEDDLVERNFKIPYEEDVYLVGKWDRIVPSSNLAFDWKTGKYTPSVPMLSRDPQFIMYDLAYQYKFDKKPLLYYASLYSGKLVKYKENKENVTVLFEHILPNMIDQIRAGKFYCEGLFKFNSPCRTCVYKEFCWNELVGRDLTP
jgi:hypothetical protein